jgi:hypothetical protein
MDSDLVRILTDPLNDDKYIVDDTFCYVFANGQLTESAALPTALCAIDGNLVAARDTGSTDVVVQLQTQDMNLVGMKSVEFLEIGVQTDGTVYGDLSFSYSLGQDEHTLGLRLANPSAFVYLGATANYFRPKATIVAPTSLTLAYLTYGVKVSDNRIQNQLQTMSDRSWNAG